MVALTSAGMTDFLL